MRLERELGGPYERSRRVVVALLRVLKPGPLVGFALTNLRLSAEPRHSGDDVMLRCKWLVSFDVALE